MMNVSRYGKNGWKIVLFKLMVVIIFIAFIGVGVGVCIVKYKKKGVSEGDSLFESTNIDNELNVGNSGDDININPDNLQDQFENTIDQPFEEVFKISLIQGSPSDINQYSALPVIAANATSTIQQDGTNNDAILLFDGRDDTSWQEGVSGYGIGESVSFSFDQFYFIKYLSFKLGNWKNDEYYYGNAKPKTVTVVVGGCSEQVTFSGEKVTEWIELSEEINADSMRIELNDIYKGTKWEDTCITEICAYGR